MPPNQLLFRQCMSIPTEHGRSRIIWWLHARMMLRHQLNMSEMSRLQTLQATPFLKSIISFHFCSSYLTFLLLYCREGQISQVFDCLMADQKVTYSTENSKNRPVTCTIRIVSYLQLSKSVAFINLFYQNTPVIYSQIVQYVFHPQTNDVLVPILVS